MILKKRVLFAIVAFMIAACFIATPKSNAADLAPGEGGYVGAFVGFGTGLIQAKVATLDQVGQSAAGEANTIELERGGLGLSGIQGGGYAGWGMKTADDLYFGAEVGMAASDEKFEITSTKGVKTVEITNADVTFTKVTAKRNWVAGGALRVGYYVNSETLFALKGGVAVSQFDLSIGSDNETYYAGGPQMGASVETKLSKVDPNLSLRMEFVYTDYLTADILGSPGQGIFGAGTGGSDNTITGHDSAGRIGLQYSFF
jgi:hypothetical protein